MMLTHHGAHGKLKLFHLEDGGFNHQRDYKIHHIHIFANIPPHIKVSEFVQKAKGRSSKKIQEEFPILRKKYWGRHLWARGYFSSTSGNVTDDMINEYINRHTDAHEPAMTTNIRLE